VLFLKALPPPQIAREGFEWVNEGSKWSYKVSECNETYVTKWLLIAHFKKCISSSLIKVIIGTFQLMNGAFDVKTQQQ
jgi:hypothetical protein